MYVCFCIRESNKRIFFFFFFQAEDGIRDRDVTGVQTCALPILEAGCVDHQRAAGLHGAWLEQIPAFLDSATLDPVPRPVLLHTEVMREHLLVTPHPDGWSLSGLLDFEPAMRGAREYEFAAVGLFVSRGD